MNDIYEMKLDETSREEQLEDFSDDFPYTTSRAFVNRYDVFWHWHKAVELFYMESGTLEYDTPQGRWPFPQGSGGLVNTGVLHTSHPLAGSGDTIQLLHIFDASLLFGQPESRIAKKYFSPILTTPQIEVIPLLPQAKEHREILAKIRDSFALNKNGFGYELKLCAALGDIWLDLLKLCPTVAEQGRKTSSERIKKMMIFVHEHYRKRLKISDIAAAGYVSERECYRAFQTFLHTTPAEYLKEYRLKEARKMLADSKETVTQISYACGFGSSSFFGKVFLAYTGMTPTAYRQKWQNIT